MEPYTYQDAIHEGLGYDPEQNLDPLRLKGEIYGLEMRGDYAEAESAALAKALESIVYICEQRAQPPSEMYKHILSLASSALTAARGQEAS